MDSQTSLLYFIAFLSQCQVSQKHSAKILPTFRKEYGKIFRRHGKIFTVPKRFAENCRSQTLR